MRTPTPGNVPSYEGCLNHFHDLNTSASRANYTRPTAHSHLHLATTFPASRYDYQDYTRAFGTKTLQDPRGDPRKLPALSRSLVISYKKGLDPLQLPNINTTTNPRISYQSFTNTPAPRHEPQ